MNIVAHFRSLAAEFSALQDRVRNIIDDAHWQTDGEWRESILRSVLRRHLPETVGVGRGFIATAESRSTQIDVLIYDRSAPLLYRDHDLVIVTPDAVLGVIEVKSTIRRGDLAPAVHALVANGDLASWRDGEPYRNPPFLGLFAYGLEVPNSGAPTWVLRELHAVAAETGRTISQACFDASYFVHYWPAEPHVWASLGYDHWHLYDLQEMARGYFVHNIVQHVAGQSVMQNFGVWFPEQSKEIFVVERVPFPSMRQEA